MQTTSASLITAAADTDRTIGNPHLHEGPVSVLPVHSEPARQPAVPAFSRDGRRNRGPKALPAQAIAAASIPLPANLQAKQDEYLKRVQQQEATLAKMSHDERVSALVALKRGVYEEAGK